MKRFLREPLVHFALLGAALFGLASLRTGRVEGEPKRVVITQAQIDQIITGFSLTWQRPPTEGELAALVEDFIREEIYSREAAAMGLDRGDTVIRRRLRQKFEFLTEDALASAPPTDEELRAHLRDHADVFRVEPRVALQQVLIRRDLHGPAAEDDARKLLATLSSGEALDDPSALGDASLLPASLELSSLGDVARQFGEAFATAALLLSPGRWEGPIESSFGLHLVRITARVDERTPELEEVRDAVEREWLAARRAERKEALYRELRNRYTVVVEPPK